MKADQLQALYHDTQACAELVGLSYVSDEKKGLGRQKAGKGFRFMDTRGKTITEKDVKARLARLAVPPAWQQVWLCPTDKGHIQATGIDEKGRKQYIYHPRWRQMRELINFYRLMSFGERLPTIRREVKEQLSRHTLDRDQLLALMVWFLDNSYIRIGNEAYFEANDSVGLTTLRKKNISVKGDTIMLDFSGKSSQLHHIELKDKVAAKLVAKLLMEPNQRLFHTPKVGTLTPSDCNAFLQGLTDEQMSAKDFRTWGGTLAAFEHLKKKRQSQDDPEKVALEAIDQAAEVLGNTRNVARDHYVHPHVLETYTEETFNSYYKKLKPRRVQGLFTSEVELLQFLEILFKTEFDVLAMKRS